MTSSDIRYRSVHFGTGGLSASDIASDADVKAGVSTTKVVTPAGLAARENVVFYALRTTSQAISNNTWTSITWDTPVADTEGFLLSSGNELTMAAGLWQIDAIGSWAASPYGTRSIRILQDGFEISQGDEATLNISNQRIDTGVQAGTSNGTKIKIQVFQDSGASLNITFAGIGAPILMIARLGGNR